MEPGKSWRKHCWTAARTVLVPHIPIEILRGRLRRAAELGLDYKTYAGIRAQTGRDIVAVLYSSNALGAPHVSRAHHDRLQDVKAHRVGLATAPLRPEDLEGLPLDATFASPHPLDAFPDQRAVLRAALGKTPADAAILVGAYGLERDWVAAARFAGYVEAQHYFAPR